MAAGSWNLIFSSCFRHIKATDSESKASSRWEFDFELGKPSKHHKNYKWEALPSDEVPKVYRVNHVKRLYSVAENTSFEGQLPKLRYYHHIKKVEPQEENNNVSVKEQPITASSKKNGSTGQMKITGTLRACIISFTCNWQPLLSFQISSKRRNDSRWRRRNKNSSTQPAAELSFDSSFASNTEILYFSLLSIPAGPSFWPFFSRVRSCFCLEFYIFWILFAWVVYMLLIVNDNPTDVYARCCRKFSKIIFNYIFDKLRTKTRFKFVLVIRTVDPSTTCCTIIEIERHSLCHNRLAVCKYFLLQFSSLETIFVSPVIASFVFVLRWFLFPLLWFFFCFVSFAIF